MPETTPPGSRAPRIARRLLPFVMLGALTLTTATSASAAPVTLQFSMNTDYGFTLIYTNPGGTIWSDTRFHGGIDSFFQFLDTGEAFNPAPGGMMTFTSGPFVSQTITGAIGFRTAALVFDGPGQIAADAQLDGPGGTLLPFRFVGTLGPITLTRFGDTVGVGDGLAYIPIEHLVFDAATRAALGIPNRVYEGTYYSFWDFNRADFGAEEQLGASFGTIFLSVPEPSVVVLAGLALAAAARRRRAAARAQRTLTAGE